MNTQIPIPAELKSKAEQAAIERGISLSQFVKESLERAIASKRSEDPLFADEAVFSDDSGPNDMSANHDDYLYGDAP
jgi:hypothetical protein